jgi:glycine/D-amino acid oxidase-like deaminating enzyme
VGATQEFKDDPFDSTEVEAELKKRSNAFTSDLWDGSSIDKMTEGFRVRSNQEGPQGRMPILGRFETPIYHEAWVFTGLSSRGLLYHALFADSLSDMILGRSDNENPIDRQNLNWWQK